jgi:para-aminobenzoate synthetase component I
VFNFPISYLNSNDGSGLLAFGDGDTLKYKKGAAFPALEAFVEKHKGQFIFGYLGYDLKNETEILSSKNIDRLEFPDVHFWVPKYVVELKNEDLIFLQGEKCSESFDFLNFFMEEETDQNFHPQTNLP